VQLQNGTSRLWFLTISSFACLVQVKSMCQIALKKDYAYIDTVGVDDEETHIKVGPHT
jgi:hypothetical protein